jgi:MYXO-CTERM domain-containing protein
MHFVAVRLQANKDVSDIQPLGMTYDANKPMIPIRLTAIAAQPEMGVVTWVLAKSRFAPENYIDLKIPDTAIKFDQYGGQNNYLTLVSSESDKVGGQAFVTEYAQPTTEVVKLIQQAGSAPTPEGQAAQDALLGLLGKFPYITRLYARMSAEEMTEDPSFMASSQKSNVSNVHDLSDPKAQCNSTTQPPPVDPCTFNYCGRRGVCVTAKYTTADSGGEVTSPACACANDAIARVTTTGQYGSPAMYCEPVAQDLDGAAAGDAGNTPLVNPACEGFDCGTHGACVPMNGNPTCQCEGGYAAVASQSYDSTTNANVTKVTCQPVPGPIPKLPVVPAVGSTTLPRSSASMESGGCAVATPRPSSRSLLGLLSTLGLVLAARRRRRAS